MTSTQRDYLEFIRSYVRDNESSPRLDEIASHFEVKSPTAHKILEALQSKGYLYFGRDTNSGFFIRLIERAGTAETVMEVPIAGRVNKMGELYDFPQNLGHFVSVFVGAKPGNVVALLVAEDIPQANMLAGDLIIFDLEKKPQPGDICIGPMGKNRLFLIQIISKTMDADMQTYETAMDYPIPEKLSRPELGQRLNWHPLAFDDENADWFVDLAEKEHALVAALPENFIIGTALRLTRGLAV